MDFTIGRTLGSRELASSKVKSFITYFAGTIACNIYEAQFTLFWMSEAT